MVYFCKVKVIRFDCQIGNGFGFFFFGLLFSKRMIRSNRFQRVSLPVVYVHGPAQRKWMPRHSSPSIMHQSETVAYLSSAYPLVLMGVRDFFLFSFSSRLRAHVKLKRKEFQTGSQSPNRKHLTTEYHRVKDVLYKT